MKERLDHVDVLRGVACLWVVLYHVGMWWLGASSGWDRLVARASAHQLVYLQPARLGFLGVSLFLVISGFCLYYPLVARSGVEGARVEVGRFLLRRAQRLLPPYWASMALVLALAALPGLARVTLGAVGMRDVVTHLTLTHNLFPDTMWSINGVYWTLALEWQLYLLFPGFVFVARRFGIVALGVAAASISLAWPWVLRGPLGYAEATGGLYGVLYEAVPARLFEFVAGMIAAALTARRVRVHGAWLAVLVVAFVPVAWHRHVVDVWSFPFDKVVCGVSFAALVLLAGQRPARLATTAAWRGALALGALTYSFYLVHQPLMLLSAPWFDALGLRGGTRLAVALTLGVGLLVAAAKVFYVAFEAPVLRWMERGRAQSVEQRASQA